VKQKCKHTTISNNASRCSSLQFQRSERS